MDKETIKARLREALAENPHAGDIKSAAVFDSCIHEPDQAHDIDVLIDFLPSAAIGYFELARIQRHLSERIGRPVDLLTPDALSHFFRDEVLDEAEPFYER